MYSYRITLFGILTEIASTSELKYELDERITKNSLYQKLLNDYPAFKLVQCQLVVNKQIHQVDINLSNTDELVLMPPFAGG